MTDNNSTTSQTQQKRKKSLFTKLLALLIITLVSFGSGGVQAQTLTGSTKQFFTYLNQFLLGFRASSFMPSIDSCANNLEYSVSDFDRTYNFLMYDKNYLWFDYTFNVTQLISTTIADCSRDCTLAALQSVNQTVSRA